MARAALSPTGQCSPPGEHGRAHVNPTSTTRHSDGFRPRSKEHDARRHNDPAGSIASGEADPGRRRPLPHRHRDAASPAGRGTRGGIELPVGPTQAATGYIELTRRPWPLLETPRRMQPGRDRYHCPQLRLSSPGKHSSLAISERASLHRAPACSNPRCDSDQPD